MDASRRDFGTRMAQAVVAGIAAALTLVIFPFAIGFFFANGGGGIGAADASIGLVKLAFSKVGLAFVGLAMLAGFFFHPDRVADAFSFIWGTHPFWSTAEEWNSENISSGVVAFILSIVAAIVIWWQLY